VKRYLNEYAALLKLINLRSIYTIALYLKYLADLMVILRK